MGNKLKQAGAELCQAQLSLKLASLTAQLLNCLTALLPDFVAV